MGMLLAKRSFQMDRLLSIPHCVRNDGPFYLQLLALMGLVSIGDMGQVSNLPLRQWGDWVVRSSFEGAGQAELAKLRPYGCYVFLIV